MLIKQTNDKGEEVEIEVLSPEEVEAKLREKEAELTKIIQEKDTTLSTLQKEKEELASKMSGTKEDHPNFKALKEALKAKDDEMKKLKDDVENDKKQRKAEMMEAKIKEMTGGKKEVADKVKLHLTSTLSGMPENTEEERHAKLNAALKLSVDYAGGQPNILDSVMYGAGSAGAGAPREGSAVEFTAREKALGAKMGITEEDYKKYSSRLTNK